MPGVSVLTPKRRRSAGSAVRSGKGKTQQQDVVGWDSESEEGEGEDGRMGFSPPKTMQFHIPQGRLMRTPGMCYPTNLFLLTSSIIIMLLFGSCGAC